MLIIDGKQRQKSAGFFKMLIPTHMPANEFARVVCDASFA